MFNSFKRAFPPLLISVFFFIPVLAQPVLEEIIVTADYRQNSLDDIAASITVINADTMAKKNAQHLEDVLLNAPNVNFSSGASRARFIQIRGIGERGQFSEPLNSSVGVMIDGVDFSGIGNAAMLYDIEQVEILMGPQGTRYGSNALAGLINLKSKTPSESFSSGLQLQGGSNNSQGLAGFISGPATDNFFYRLSMQKLESDGFSQNLFLNKPTNQRDETTLRAKFQWQITDTEQLDFTTSLIDLDNGYDVFSLDNARDTLSDEPGFDRQDSTLASVKFTSSSFDAFTLELLGGFAQSDIQVSIPLNTHLLIIISGIGTLPAQSCVLSQENPALFFLVEPSGWLDCIPYIKR